MGILETIKNIANEGTIAIGAVVGLLVLLAFVVHWAKSRFTLASALTGLLTAGVVGWAAAVGVKWLADQLGSTIENNSALVDSAYLLISLA